MRQNASLKSHSPSTRLKREQKKFDKRERIRAAARELFAESGYDAATLRQIASRARVGLGTLFDYASSKRDLVFLISNQDLELMVNESLAAALSEETLFNQVIAMFRVSYIYFASDLELSRLLLREQLFYSEGNHAADFKRIRGRILKGLGRIVGTALLSGQIESDEAPEFIARNLFYTAWAATRWWIASPDPDPAEGIQELQRLIAIQFQGLSPKKKRIAPSRSREA